MSDDKTENERAYETADVFVRDIDFDPEEQLGGDKPCDCKYGAARAQSEHQRRDHAIAEQARRVVRAEQWYRWALAASTAVSPYAAWTDADRDVVRARGVAFRAYSEECAKGFV